MDVFSTWLWIFVSGMKTTVDDDDGGGGNDDGGGCDAIDMAV